MHVEVRFDAEGNYAITHEGRVIAPGPGPLPAPPVLFLGSLAACAGLFAVNYMKARGLPCDGLNVVGEAGHADDPRRLVDVRLHVLLPHPIEERHIAPLRRSVDLCTLKNSLTHPPAIVAQVEAFAPALAR